jgi:Domain of unknown function DUF1829/Domain of unknown function DUF1828
MTQVAEIEQLVDRYRSWLKDKTKLKSVHSEWVEITTPFLDRHNDYIQLYVKKENESFRLTDDGNTIRDLEISGCNLDTPKRKGLLETAVRGFTVDATDNILSVRASAENFPLRKHALIQAILAVNDLFYTASPTVRSLFKEDVEAWLRLSEIRFLPNVQFSGKTGYLHNFDFAIPQSGRAPERIMRAVSNPTKDATESFIFSWLDTREVRPSDSVAIAMLNDQEKVISGTVLEAFRQYDIEPVRWSEREANRERLAA